MVDKELICREMDKEVGEGSRNRFIRSGLLANEEGVGMKARGWPSCFMLAVIQAIAGSSSLAGLGAIAGSSVKASSNSPSVLVFNEEDKLTIRNDDSIYVVEVSALTDSLAVSLLPADALPKYQGKPFQRYPAVFGFYRLPLGHYVALVKKSTPIEGLSSIGAVQKVEQVVLLQIPGSAAAAANQSLADEHNRQLKELEKAFKRHQFIFSSGSYDVLCSLQANAQGLGSSERFNWNKLAIQPLASAAGCNKLVTRFVNAMVSSMEFVLHGKRFVLTLIARRSKEQQGHRCAHFMYTLAPFLTLCQIYKERKQRRRGGGEFCRDRADPADGGQRLERAACFFICAGQGVHSLALESATYVENEAGNSFGQLRNARPAQCIGANPFQATGRII